MQDKTIVIIEHNEGTPTRETLDVLAFAADFADSSGTALTGLLLSDKGHDLLDKINKTLPIPVTLLSSPPLAVYTAEAYTAALYNHLNDPAARYILVPHSPCGYDYAPALAVKLGIPCITSVTSAEFRDNAPFFSRLTASGKLIAETGITGSRCIITVNPSGKNFSGKGNYHNRQNPAKPEVIPIDLSLKKTINVLRKKTAPGSGDLLRAEVVIAAGKGLGKIENMELLKELASLFPRSAIAGSRGACDMGYTDYSLQVGMTGKSLSPGLYIACGISGSPQHIAGIKNAGTIVSVNRDPDAPIHRIADISIVEKIEDFIPEFIKVLSNL